MSVQLAAGGEAMGPKKGDAYMDRPSSPCMEKCRLQPSWLHIVRHDSSTVTECVTDSAFHFSNSCLKNNRA